MKEMFEQLPRITLSDKVEYLIDTCFFIYIFEYHKQKDFEGFIKEHDCAITSFNVEEFLHIEHKVNDEVRHHVRKFLHNNNDLHVLEVPVHPGDQKGEHEFVKSILRTLDEKEHDPSDAVLLAATIKVGANVLTRDKHDIFNAILKNFLNDYHVKVLNKF